MNLRIILVVFVWEAAWIIGITDFGWLGGSFIIASRQRIIRGHSPRVIS